MRIIDAVCRWPGSAHDAIVFRNSALHEKFTNGEFGVDSAIITDSAYALDDFVCKPLQNPRSESEKRYQFAQVRSRNVVERTYGVLKRKFQCLSEGMAFGRETIQDIILSCCILHNFMLDHNPDGVLRNNRSMVDMTLPIEREELERQFEISESFKQARREHPINIQNFLVNNFF